MRLVRSAAAPQTQPDQLKSNSGKSMGGPPRRQRKWLIIVPLLVASAVKLSLAAVLSVTNVVPSATAVKPAPKVTRSVVALSATDTQMVTLINTYTNTLEKLAPPGALPGTWINSYGCFTCDAGPAMAYATVAGLTRDAKKQAVAVAVFDAIIKAQQQPNGAFGTGGGPDIGTMFFANALGSAAVITRGTLDATHKITWAKSVARAADYLVANGNLRWYTNGNINIGNALTMALAARLTGNPAYKTHFETALQFAISPPQPRWAGYGLHYTKKPTRADGSDGKAYFAEAGAGGIGYDPEYSMVQLEMLTRLYLVTHDARVSRLMNLVLNQLLDRVNKTTWIMDASRGTRHTEAVRNFPFDTSGLSVAVTLGGRTDLRPLVAGQVAAMERYLRSNISQQGGRMRGAIGTMPPSIIMGNPANAHLR